MKKGTKTEGKFLFMKEIELFPPVKLWLEHLGFEVQGEIGDMDVYACRFFCGKEDTLSTPPSSRLRTPLPSSSSADISAASTLTIAVELKLKPCLDLILQAVERISSADMVYIAFPENKKAREIKKLCDMLGIGILEIIYSPHSDVTFVREFLPALHSKRRLNNHSKRKLIEEFRSRRVRNAVGGTNGKVLTAYRQQATAIAFFMLREGDVSLGMLRERGVVQPEKYVYANHYGWFEKTERRGYYRLTEFGRQDILCYNQYRSELDIL